MTTSEVSTTELTTTVSAADIVTGGAAQIEVVNSAPGVGTSNSLAFTIVSTAIPGFVYVANGIGVSLTAGNISALSVDPNTGVLTPVAGSPFNSGAQPTAIASDPSGAFLYETSNLGVITPSNNISAFAISPTTGALTPVPGSPFTGGIYPISISVDSTGKFVYTADSGGDSNGNSISGFGIDATTGALTPISQTSCAAPPLDSGGLCNSVAADPAAGFLFGSNGFGYVSAFSITSQDTLDQIAGSPFREAPGNAFPGLGKQRWEQGRVEQLERKVGQQTLESASMSFQLAIPWLVALLHCPPPLHQPTLIMKHAELEVQSKSSERQIVS